MVSEFTNAKNFLVNLSERLKESNITGGQKRNPISRRNDTVGEDTVEKKKEHGKDAVEFVSEPGNSRLDKR